MMMCDVTQRHEKKTKKTVFSLNINIQRVQMAIETEILNALGFAWKLRIYPGGKPPIVASAATDTKKLKNPFVSLVRCDSRNVSIDADVSFIYAGIPYNTGRHTFNRETKGYRFSKKFVRSLSHLVIEADLGIHSICSSVWYPTLLKDSIISTMFDSGTKDVSFCVQGAVFEAHRCVLQVRAPKLFKLAEENSNVQPVEITGVSAFAFKAIIEFIYSVHNTDRFKNWSMTSCKDLVAAAHRFGPDELKLYAESFLADKHVSPQTTSDLFLFAESFDFPLLKEAAMAQFIQNSTEVMQSPKWKEVIDSKSLLNDLLMESHLRKYDDYEYLFEAPKITVDDVSKMPVGSLRNYLLKYGEHIHGTRAMLETRLRTRLEQN